MTDTGLKELEAFNGLKFVGIATLFASKSAATRLKNALLAEVYVGPADLGSVFRSIISQELKCDVDAIDLSQRLSDLSSDDATIAEAMAGIEQWVTYSTLRDVTKILERMRNGIATMSDVIAELETIAASISEMPQNSDKMR